MIGYVFEKPSYLILEYGVCAGKENILNGAKSIRLVKIIERLITTFFKKADIDFSLKYISSVSAPTII